MQKHATTIYHVIWAELLEDTLTLSFVEKRKKTRIVCIKARLWGGTKEEATEWTEDLLNVAYRGAIPTPNVSGSRNELRTYQTLNGTRG